MEVQIDQRPAWSPVTSDLSWLNRNRRWAARVGARRPPPLGLSIVANLRRARRGPGARCRATGPARVPTSVPTQPVHATGAKRSRPGAACDGPGAAAGGRRAHGIRG
jgi:hypothetical protein